MSFLWNTATTSSSVSLDFRNPASRTASKKKKKKKNSRTRFNIPQDTAPGVIKLRPRFDVFVIHDEQWSGRRGNFWFAEGLLKLPRKAFELRVESSNREFPFADRYLRILSVILAGCQSIWLPNDCSVQFNLPPKTSHLACSKKFTKFYFPPLVHLGSSER